MVPNVGQSECAGYDRHREQTLRGKQNIFRHDPEYLRDEICGGDETENRG